jgi:hypothetical protein
MEISYRFAVVLPRFIGHAPTPAPILDGAPEGCSDSDGNDTRYLTAQAAILINRPDI